MIIVINQDLNLQTPTLAQASSMYQLQLKDIEELESIYYFMDDTYNIEKEKDSIIHMGKNNLFFYIAFQDIVCGKIGIIADETQKNHFNFFLYVASSHRRKGIGLLAMKEFLRYIFRRNLFFTLHFYVQEENRSALNLVVKSPLVYKGMEEKNLLQSNGKIILHHYWADLETLRQSVQIFERIDGYDEQGHLLNSTYLRGSILPSGVYSVVVEIITVNPQGQVLLTQRAANKLYPFCWEITGGSVISGESIIDGAIRELQEETGIFVQKQQLYFLKQTKNCSVLFQTFVTFLSTPPKIILQEGETIHYNWVSVQEFEQIIKTGQFIGKFLERYEKIQKEFHHIYQSKFTKLL